jgi:hypothetical protein
MQETRRDFEVKDCAHRFIRLEYVAAMDPMKTGEQQARCTDCGKLVPLRGLTMNVIEIRERVKLP